MKASRLLASALALFSAALLSGCGDDDDANEPIGRARGEGGTGGSQATTGGRATGGSSEGSGGGENGAAGNAEAGASPGTGGSQAGAGGATDARAAGSAGTPTETGTGGVDGAAGAEGGGPTRVATCPGDGVEPLAGASLPDGYCAWIWAEGVAAPRGIFVDEAGDTLVLERDAQAITVLFDDDGDGVVGSSERIALGTADGINHGITADGTYLYASSATTVYRWPYEPGARAPLGEPTEVATGLPGGSGHVTRTLALDEQGRLYVSMGSGANVDPDSSRARILRFTPAQLEAGTTLAEGEVFADGLRNEVGLRFDANGTLWGVENERDNLMREDLGGDIHDDNPGEELNRFDEAGLFYGYPYCWPEYDLPGTIGLGAGTQWADPDFMDDGTHSDEWCRNTDNVVPPVLSLQAHSAPLDIHFYAGGSFPADVVGDAFVAFHGSWNRSLATGYKVVRLPFGPDGAPTGEVVPLLESAGEDDRDADWPHRPVGLAELPSGVLLVTSDASDVVIAVGHDAG